mmetsp:Transcript_2022/g.5328  ORF Transcript_2022/g.5328 Transcript_2022/m.5328 type:complete len:301 (-) Transcript_2022:125-1027(-)
MNVRSKTALPVRLIAAAFLAVQIWLLLVGHSLMATSVNTSLVGGELFTNGASPISKNAAIPKTRARLCKEGEVPSPEEFVHKSQYGEDKELFRLFKFDKLCNGTYLEIGGLDGIKYSNSYVFHQALGWRGVLVEASPTNYAKLVENRPNEVANVNAGICGEERDLHWVNHQKMGAVSGFVELAAPTFQRKWWSENDINNAKVIKCKTLRTVISEAVGGDFFFDFFSLDIEGAEYDAIVSIDFSIVSFGVIFVEADEHNELKNLAVKMHLERNGYAFAKSSNNSDWFVNTHFMEIYKGIIR